MENLEKQIADKLQVEVRSVRRNDVLKNSKLIRLILDNDIIYERDLIKKYDISIAQIQNLRKKNMVSYFTVYGINTNVKGTKIYYILDELKELFGEGISYTEGFALRMQSAVRHFVINLEGIVSPRERQILEEYFYKGKNYEEIAQDYHLTKERVRQLITKSIYRASKYMQNRTDWFDLSRQISELKHEIIVLKKIRGDMARSVNKYNETGALSEIDATQALHIKNACKKYKIATSSANDKVRDWDLSTRLLNTLGATDFETLGDLIVYDWRTLRHTLMKCRNFGEKSLNELKDYIEHKYNFNWK